MSVKYNYQKAAEFWNRRLKSTDPLSAVLTYDAPAGLNEAYNFWELETLKNALSNDISNKKALDIACGIGRISLTLAKLGAEVSSVDISEKMLEHLIGRAKRMRLTGSISPLCAPSDKLPFGDRNKFDIITCFGLLEHLPAQERKNTLLECFRLLKSTGKLYLSVNNSHNIILKPKYGMKQQQADGYYVDLVGLNWLENIAKTNKIKIKVIGSNPLYALNHYFIYPKTGKLFKSDETYNEFCRNLAGIDLGNGGSNIFSDELASHFILELKKIR